MSPRARLAVAALAGGLLLLAPGPAGAARVRYHCAADPSGSGYLKPAAAGERLTLGGWRPCDCPPPRPTQVVTFRHPGTGRNVTVPLALPASTPRMEYVRDRVVYDYSTSTVEVRFLPDGSADVTYDSGLLRAP